MNGISFFVYGIPQRHSRRSILRNGKMASYEGKDSQDWRQSVRLQSLNHKPSSPSAAPISAELSFQFLKPKSLSRKVTAHIKRPDAENLLKSTLDAMTGIMWRDDSQIVRLVVTKQYSEIPGVRIAIQEVDL